MDYSVIGFLTRYNFCYLQIVGEKCCILRYLLAVVRHKFFPFRELAYLMNLSGFQLRNTLLTIPSSITLTGALTCQISTLEACTVRLGWSGSNTSNAIALRKADTLSVESSVTTSASFSGQSSTRYQSREGSGVVGERVGELSEVKFVATVMALVDLASGRSGDFRRRIKSESKTERRFSSDALRALLTLGGLLADEYYLSNEKNINL